MKKAIFLDRDGVINKVVKKYSLFHKEIVDDSPFNVSELVFNEGIKEIINTAKEKNYEVIVVTNQPSIVKGSLSLKDYEEITSKVCEYLKIERKNVFECFHKEGYSLPCNCRKPKPGLFLMAQGMLDIDLKNSVMLGDSWKDISAAQKAGIEKTIFLKREENEYQLGNLKDQEKMKSKNIVPKHFINSLEEAIRLF